MVLHGKRKNGSFYCRVDGLSKSFTSNDSKEDPLLITSIWSEILSQLELLENQLIGLEGLLVSRLMVKGIKWCFREEKKRRHYLSRLNLHIKTYSLKNNFKIRNWESHNKALLYWMQKDLLMLMRMRHKEIFGSFACLKSLIGMFRPLLDGQKLKILIRQYEETPPLSLYLSQICRDFQFAFVTYIAHHIRSRKLFLGGYSKYPDFVNERIKMLTDSSPTVHATESFPYGIEWPLEFFVNLFFGHFRRYDYVKTLQVGIEQGTYVPLIEDKRQWVLQLFQ